MRRRGFTLHELLISLGVMSVVIALAAHAATAQLRFFAGSGELIALRNQIGQASTIAATILWGVSPPGGDIIVAQDSAIEVEMPIGTSFVCSSAPGSVTMAAPGGRGNTLASFTETPEVGDRLHVLFGDSVGSTWLTLRPTSASTAAGGCGQFPDVAQSLVFTLQEQIALPPGAPLRFSRRARLSLYRGSDARWYLGTRTWNGPNQTFNTVQPVAGPLSPYSDDASRTGLRFVHRDNDGLELPAPVDVRRVASVTIVARSRSTRFEDSTVVMVALRNAQ